MGIDRAGTMEAVNTTSRRSFFGLALGGFAAVLGLSRKRAMEPLLVAEGVVPPRHGLRYTCSPGVVRVTLEPRS